MNARPVTLRRRVAFASALLGLVLCLLFVAAVEMIAEDYESVVAHEILQGQADDYVDRVDRGLPTTLPQTQRLAGYRDAPARYAALPPGVHEDESDDGRHVGVFDTRLGRLWFVIDLGGIERLERHLAAWLTVFVVLGVALSAGLGWYLAGRALVPAGRLADAVDALRVEPAPTSLATLHANDELGRLARAIDDYQMRLVDADDRQRRFFADASHELRTPVAVVRGVTDVMLDDDALLATERPRLARLDRGVQELSDLVEALFAVARRTPATCAWTDIAALLKQTLADSGDGSTLETPGASAVVAYVSAPESQVLLRTLLRRAGPLRLRLDEVGERAVLRIETADEAVEPPRLSPLMERLCERAGWLRLGDGALVLSASARADLN